MATTEHEAAEIKEANASGRAPVVFVHGLDCFPAAGNRIIPAIITGLDR
jgi:hypothetical protein